MDEIWAGTKEKLVNNRIMPSVDCYEQPAARSSAPHKGPSSSYNSLYQSLAPLFSVSKNLSDFADNVLSNVSTCLRVIQLRNPIGWVGVVELSATPALEDPHVVPVAAARPLQDLLRVSHDGDPAGA